MCRKLAHLRASVYAGNVDGRKRTCSEQAIRTLTAIQRFPGIRFRMCCSVPDGIKRKKEQSARERGERKILNYSCDFSRTKFSALKKCNMRCLIIFGIRGDSHSSTMDTGLSWFIKKRKKSNEDISRHGVAGLLLRQKKRK